MLRFTIIVLYLLASFCAISQNVPERWQTQTMKDLRTNEQSPMTCMFDIYLNDRIDWIQGDFVQSFSITSTEGSLQKPGDERITYHLIKEGKYGEVIIERINDNVFLTIDLRKDTDLGAYYRFEVFNP